MKKTSLKKSGSVPGRIALAAISVGFLQLATLQASDEPDAANAARESLFEDFGNSPEELERRLAAAKEAGVSTVTQAESRLFHALQSQNPAYAEPLEDTIAAYLDEWVEPASDFFMERTEAEAFCELVRATQARANGDIPGYRRHLFEALWLDPDQAGFIARNIFEYRKELRLADLKVPAETRLIDSQLGTEVSLTSLSAGHQATLIVFWAEWCGHCLTGMDRLKELASTLPARGIAVIAVNTDDEDARSKAEEIRTRKSMEMPWLLDSPHAPLAGLLEIDSLPTVALVDASGKVVFLGHPEDPKLTVHLSDSEL